MHDCPLHPSALSSHHLENILHLKCKVCPQPTILSTFLTHLIYDTLNHTAFKFYRNPSVTIPLLISSWTHMNFNTPQPY